MTQTRAFDFLQQQLDRFPRKDCLCGKNGKSWTVMSTAETVKTVDLLSLGLMHHGIEPGDRVAIAAENCLEWALVDLALQQIGAVSVPLYPTCTLDDARYILAHAEVKLAFAGNTAQHDKLVAATEPAALPIFAFGKVAGAPSWRQLLEAGREGDQDELSRRRDAITEDEIFTIIYTSGTTGRSKGVMLSHRNVVSTVRSSAAHTGLPRGTCRAISFLPLSHIFERACVHYYLHTGTGVYFSTVEQLSSTLSEVRPHTFSAVPRVLEKVYEKLAGKARTLSGVTRKLYIWALHLAEHYEPNARYSLFDKARYAIARQLVFNKWYQAMGGELRWINVGSAALQPRLARLFWACGVVVSEGYGMTESAPVIAANPFNAAGVRIGTVGIPMPGVEVRFADDGEILVRGDNVMEGYYKEPELTAEVLRGGWLHTGDIGVMEQGYIRITDRKKEMFKTSNGKYIAPQAIENKLKESAFIDQVMVVGDGEKYPSALIVPLFDKLREWCADQGICYTSDHDMTLHPKVHDLIDREIKRFNHYFGSWEHIRKFTLLDRAWCVDQGELAPTLKLRRKVITERCRDMIERMYAHQPELA
ncbi:MULTISPECIES: long-chain fatty acid--CoA ligase [unclassified Paludibacterium]|uniref:AMP-dependent synthetase/ligase n=1 Tax=unclassified Paludibacterium TaxID=2618429 RepID=UPI001C053FAB|nr:long-chain fatty acid--CoA ligase [Paludibacterium sp. B53371]BEV73288.1 long-chain fatty acid--CoA ligase [Paludibacterium sp. THUN1379]